MLHPVRCLFLIYAPVISPKLTFFKNDLIGSLPRKIFEIRENSDYDRCIPFKTLFGHYLILQKVNLIRILEKIFNQIIISCNSFMRCFWRGTVLPW